MPASTKMVTRWASLSSSASGKMSMRAEASKAPAAKAVAYIASFACFLLARRIIPPRSEIIPPARDHKSTCKTIGIA